MSNGKPNGGVKSITRYLAWLGVIVGLLAVLYALGAALMYKYGNLDLGTALRTGFGNGIYGALAGAGIILFAGYVQILANLRFHWLAIVGSLVALAFVIVVVPQILTARQVPPIHDITTDTENPPQFVAILPLREAECQETRRGRCNGADYVREPEYLIERGVTVPQLQKYAYADIEPLMLADDRSVAFTKTLEVVRSMGWKLVDASEGDGRIEASDTSFWFGFTDDVVIRVADREDGGTRVDIRSKSRVGRSDVGINAKRIRAFLEKMRSA